MSEEAASRIARQFEFIAECDKLKEIFRQTVNSQSRRRENDAEHSWHICLCVIVLAEHANQPGLDVLRVLKMLLVHDLVEIDAGDTFGYDTARQADQHARECVAAERIFGLLPPDQARDFRGYWDEFEAQQTPEARFALACDRLQPVLLHCLTGGGAWKQHGVALDRVLERNSRIGEGARPVWQHLEPRIRAVFEAARFGSGGPIG
jgi:putative hydrolase of HD superfamily